MSWREFYGLPPARILWRCSECGVETGPRAKLCKGHDPRAPGRFTPERRKIYRIRERFNKAPKHVREQAFLQAGLVDEAARQR